MGSSLTICSIFPSSHSLYIVDIFRVSQLYWMVWTEHRDLDFRPGFAYKQLSDFDCKLLEPQCPYFVKWEVCKLPAHGLNLVCTGVLFAPPYYFKSQNIYIRFLVSLKKWENLATWGPHSQIAMISWALSVP